MLVNEDGTRTIIRKNIGERCPYATPNHFWQLPKDVKTKVETRMMEIEKKKQQYVVLRNTLNQSINQSINQS